MKKHKFNILPGMDEVERLELRSNMEQHGYDHLQPVIVFEGDVLDGWHRYETATELGISYSTRPFDGTALDAINFVLRSMTRRNLTSQQRAAIAVEADDIIEALKEAVEAERRRRISAAMSEAEKNDSTEDELDESSHYEIDEYSQLDSDDEMSQQIDSSEEVSLKQLLASNSPAADNGELTYEMDQPDNRNQRKVSHKLAKQFNTNRTYVSKAAKLKETAPEKLEEVKAGRSTFQQVEKEMAESESIEELADDPTRDAFTLSAEKLSKKLHSLFGEIKEAVTAAKVEFTDLGQMPELWISRLMSSEYVFELAEVKKLRSIRVCPTCHGKECGDCNQTGYVTGSAFLTLAAGKD